MELQSMVCPNCGAKIEWTGHPEFAVCEYCDSRFHIDDGSEKIHYVDEARLKELELEEKRMQQEEAARRQEQEIHKTDEETFARTQRAQYICVALFVISILLSAVGITFGGGLFLVSVIGLIYHTRRKNKLSGGSSGSKNVKAEPRTSTYRNATDEPRTSAYQNKHRTKKEGYTQKQVIEIKSPYYTVGVSSKNKLTALILCIFGGVWGIHYFYVGRIGMGLLYLFTGGVCCIGWLIDLYRIASGKFRDKDGNQLR